MIIIGSKHKKVLDQFFKDKIQIDKVICVGLIYYIINDTAGCCIKYATFIKGGYSLNNLIILLTEIMNMPGFVKFA